MLVVRTGLCRGLLRTPGFCRVLLGVCRGLCTGLFRTAFCFLECRKLQKVIGGDSESFNIIGEGSWGREATFCPLYIRVNILP